MNSSLFVRIVAEIVQRGEGLVGNFPLAEDLVNDARRETGADKTAHDSRSFLFVLRFAHALAFEVLASESFFDWSGRRLHPRSEAIRFVGTPLLRRSCCTRRWPNFSFSLRSRV